MAVLTSKYKDLEYPDDNLYVEYEEGLGEKYLTLTAREDEGGQGTILLDRENALHLAQSIIQFFKDEEAA